LTQPQLLALGKRLLAASDRWFSVRVEHVAYAVTKVANGRVSTQDGDRVQFFIVSAYGSGFPLSIDSNQLNDVTLGRVLEMVERAAPPRPPANEIEPDDPDDDQYYTYNAQALPPVALWHDSTAAAMDTARGEVIPALTEQIGKAGLMGATTVGFSARSLLYLYKQGLTSFSEETDSEVTVTARSKTGSASGWSGAADRDWSRVVPADVAARAITLSELSRNPVAFEPGRRVAILGPAAVAQLVFEMASAFEAGCVRLGASPLSDPRRTNGQRTKIGRRVFDPRLTLLSDPADQMGGFPPFFDDFSIEWKVKGYPTPAITWIEGGILKNLAYKVEGAAGLRLTAADVPRSAHMTTVPGTKTATIEEMIANCQEGVYVNRFSDMQLLDDKTMMMTGVTRDGCFLIKNGKIHKPIKNLRFTDSPFFAFNKVLMVGKEERVAFGAPRSTGEYQSRWPRLPVIVPPMMIQDFNFSALCDAI